jgi:hypothetical protein
MLRQLLKFAWQNLRLSPNRKPQIKDASHHKDRGNHRKSEGLIPKDA